MDRNLTTDNWTRHRRGEDFGAGSEEELGRYHLKAWVKYYVLVEFCNMRGPAGKDELILDR